MKRTYEFTLGDAILTRLPVPPREERRRLQKTLRRQDRRSFDSGPVMLVALRYAEEKGILTTGEALAIMRLVVRDNPTA